MKNNIFAFLVMCISVVVITVAGAEGVSAQVEEKHDAFVGVVEKVDAEAKMIYVESRDGVVKAFKWTKKTSFHGIKEATVWGDHAAHVGAHVVIRSIKVAGEDTIRGIHWFSHGTAKVVEGTVRFVGKNSKKIAVKVADRAEEIYDVSEHAVVHTAKSIGHGAKAVEKASEKEVKATVHVVESGGKKFVHFFRQQQ